MYTRLLRCGIEQYTIFELKDPGDDLKVQCLPGRTLNFSKVTVFKFFFLFWSCPYFFFFFFFNSAPLIFPRRLPELDDPSVHCCSNVNTINFKDIKIMLIHCFLVEEKKVKVKKKKSISAVSAVV